MAKRLNYICAFTNIYGFAFKATPIITLLSFSNFSPLFLLLIKHSTAFVMRKAVNFAMGIIAQRDWATVHQGHCCISERVALFPDSFLVTRELLKNEVFFQVLYSYSVVAIKAPSQPFSFTLWLGPFVMLCSFRVNWSRRSPRMLFSFIHTALWL